MADHKLIELTSLTYAGFNKDTNEPIYKKSIIFVNPAQITYIEPDKTSKGYSIAFAGEHPDLPLIRVKDITPLLT
jgi:hypothetical protein